MASKRRCPTGECRPASRWIKASRLHPLIPRQSPRWWKLYASRGAVEREFGRLKNEWALLPLRVRGIERVRLHANLDDPRQARLRARASAQHSYRGPNLTRAVTRSRAPEALEAWAWEEG